MNQLSLIPLAPNQRIEEWSKIYKTATAGLDSEKKKIDYLPLYVCRNEGEREIAFLATKEDTLDKAFKKITELIEGKASLVESTRRFFAFNTSDVSLDLKSIFFKLRALGDEAKITKDVVMLRFLGLVAAGEKFYDENKGDFKAEMTDAKMLELFVKLQPKLNVAEAKREATIKKEINVKQERTGDGYVFTAEEESMPAWVETMEDLRGELNSIKDYLIDKDEEDEPPDNDSTKEPSEDGAFYVKQGRNSRRRTPCEICGKISHFAAQCFRRKCDMCHRTGHSAHECNAGKSKPYYGKKSNRENRKPNL